MAIRRIRAVDRELRASTEEVRQQGAPLVGLEAVLFVDADPGQLLPSSRQLIAANPGTTVVGQL